MGTKQTAIDAINELKIAIEKIINSNLWQGQLDIGIREVVICMHVLMPFAPQ